MSTELTVKDESSFVTSSVPSTKPSVGSVAISDEADLGINLQPQPLEDPTPMAIVVAEAPPDKGNSDPSTTKTPNPRRPVEAAAVTELNQPLPAAKTATGNRVKNDKNKAKARASGKTKAKGNKHRVS